MILPFATALAGELPWECPTVTTPEEAEPYDDDAGLGDVLDGLEDAALAWWDDTCAWSYSSSGDADTQTCVTSAGAEVTYTYEESFDGYATTTVATLTVVPPAGAETWTSLTITSDRDISEWGTSTSSGSSRSASWAGAVADAPDDGSIEAAEASAYDYSGGRSRSSHSGSYSTPGCTWGWSSTTDAGFSEQYTRTIGDRTVLVEAQWECMTAYPLKAYVDGALYGAVTSDTWALNEVDRDGFSTADGDCDDTDPTVYPCADEVALDGIDQDCDGADLTDGDADGHDAASVGGDDCDDTDPAVYPGANDTAGDGRDGDCDGADDVDADGDHYTADGDDRAADCDDTDPDAYPGGREDGGDGVDQDCDGHDDVDADFDTWTADGDDRAADCDDTDPAVYPGAPETPADGIDQDCDGRDDPAPEDTGSADSGSTAPDVDDDADTDPEDDAPRCGGADALLLLPLARLRRRR